MNYYIFSKHETIPSGCGLKTVKEARISFDKQRSRRIFGTDAFDGQILYVFLVQPKNEDSCICIDNERYVDDGNKAICSLLSVDGYYGYSSKRINSYLGNIINIDDDGVVEIRGEDGWSSLKEFFDVLKTANIPYVVLRKYERLPESFIDGDHDIDILCMDLREMALLTGATKRNIGISAYQVIIDGIKTDFDIRFLGDGYIDSLWASEILDGRVENDNGIFVMNNENQLFSILYHCLTQKTSISKYYKNQIEKLFGIVFSNNIEARYYSKYLAAYMKSKKYSICTPLDISVLQNKKNIKQLKKDVYSNNKKNEHIRNAYIKTPYAIRKMIPKNKKEKIFDKYI